MDRAAALGLHGNVDEVVTVSLEVYLSGRLLQK